MPTAGYPGRRVAESIERGSAEKLESRRPSHTKKWGCRVNMSPDSPNIASLGFGPNSSYHELPTGYFGDLAVSGAFGCTTPG